MHGRKLAAYKYVVWVLWTFSTSESNFDQLYDKPVVSAFDSLFIEDEHSIFVFGVTSASIMFLYLCVVYLTKYLVSISLSEIPHVAFGPSNSSLKSPLWNPTYFIQLLINLTDFFSFRCSKMSSCQIFRIIIYWSLPEYSIIVYHWLNMYLCFICLFRLSQYI